jgi:carboxymethylenebutenolidase
MSQAHFIDLTRPDGQPLPALLVQPPAGTPSRAGIIVLQEWWGVTPAMRETAERVAAEGYTVLVPDLYRGRIATNPQDAEAMLHALDKADAVHQDIAACTAWLGRNGQRVGVMGFCMGGALTIASAVHVPGLTAAVCFYGIPPLTLANPADIRIPFQGHFALQDGWCTPEAAQQLASAMQAAGQSPEMHCYEADHAFFNHHRPEVYKADQAELAWGRTRDFWAKHLQA